MPLFRQSRLRDGARPRDGLTSVEQTQASLVLSKKRNGGTSYWGVIARERREARAGMRDLHP